MNTQAPATTQNKPANPLTVLHNDIMGDRMASQLKMALPDHISVEKFQRTVMTAVNKDASLLQADRRSLFTACVESAQDGLLPNGKEAALVIFNTKNRTTNQWEKRVQYMPMIQGIYKRARNSGEISMLSAHLVHENDDFDYQLGFSPNLVHKPALGNRGAIIGVYAVAELKDSTRELEFMNVEEIEAVRATSKAKDNGPWVAWWGEMARKTAVRRLAKRLPVSSDVERLINSVDAMHAYDESKKPVEPEPEMVNITPPRPTRAEFAGETVEAQANGTINEPAAEPPQQPETGVQGVPSAPESAGADAGEAVETSPADASQPEQPETKDHGGWPGPDPDAMPDIPPGMDRRGEESAA